MGATDFSYRVKHYDWRFAIKELQKQSLQMYGHQDGYSGEIHDCSQFKIHRPAKILKTDKQIIEYMNKRLIELYSREGEVLDLGVVGYLIAKPVIEDFVGYFPYDPRVLRESKDPAVLLTENGVPRAKGTLAILKKLGKSIVMRERFENDYFIVGKNTSKIYKVTGESKEVKTTTRKSNDSQLILPLHDFVIYGLAPS